MPQTARYDGYADWYEDWNRPHRVRVGMRQFPLAELVNALIRAGLAIEHVTETGDRAVPTILALRARKPG